MFGIGITELIILAILAGIAVTVIATQAGRKK
jgi:hypothetical protein